MLTREHLSAIESNVCSFQSATLPGVDFIACALSDGRISISRVIIITRNNFQPLLNSCFSSQSIVGLTTDHTSLKHGQFSTVLIIDRLPQHLYGREESDDGKFSLLAWGGGKSSASSLALLVS